MTGGIDVHSGGGVEQFSPLTPMDNGGVVSDTAATKLSNQDTGQTVSTGNRTVVQQQATAKSAQSLISPAAVPSKAADSGIAVMLAPTKAAKRGSPIDLDAKPSSPATAVVEGRAKAINDFIAQFETKTATSITPEKVRQGLTSPSAPGAISISEETLNAKNELLKQVVVVKPHPTVEGLICEIVKLNVSGETKFQLINDLIQFAKKEGAVGGEGEENLFTNKLKDAQEFVGSMSKVITKVSELKVKNFADDVRSKMKGAPREQLLMERQTKLQVHDTCLKVKVSLNAEREKPNADVQKLDAEIKKLDAQISKSSYELDVLDVAITIMTPPKERKTTLKILDDSISANTSKIGEIEGKREKVGDEVKKLTPGVRAMNVNIKKLEEEIQKTEEDLKAKGTPEEAVNVALQPLKNELAALKQERDDNPNVAKLKTLQDKDMELLNESTKLNTMSDAWRAKGDLYRFADRFDKKFEGALKDALTQRQKTIERSDRYINQVLDVNVVVDGEVKTRKMSLKKEISVECDTVNSLLEVIPLDSNSVNKSETMKVLMQKG